MGSTSTESSTTTETLRSNECDTRDIIEEPHADILKSKSVKNDSDCSLVKNQSDMKDAVQVEEHSAALCLNKISNVSTIPTISSSDNYTKDVKYIKQIENQEDNASSSNHKNRSDDILDLPGIILARLTRQAEKSDSSNPPSIENISAESDIKNKNIGSSQEKSNLEGDLGVAEDRYGFQNPYWYRGQFTNQRYRAYDRREPYRNYLKYPVFPGK